MERSAKVHFRLEQDEGGYPPAAVESVWAQPSTEAAEYVLDNVPFFTREATIGDVVRVREGDGHLWFEAVVRQSHSSFVRAVFFDRASVERINETLVNLGCATEYIQAQNLLAISIQRPVQGPSTMRSRS